MMMVAEYSVKKNKTVEQVLNVCKKVGIDVDDKNDILSEDDIIVLDFEFEESSFGGGASESSGSGVPDFDVDIEVLGQSSGIVEDFISSLTILLSSMNIQIGVYLATVGNLYKAKTIVSNAINTSNEVLTKIVNTKNLYVKNDAEVALLFAFKDGEFLDKNGNIDDVKLENFIHEYNVDSESGLLDQVKQINFFQDVFGSDDYKGKDGLYDADKIQHGMDNYGISDSLGYLALVGGSNKLVSGLINGDYSDEDGNVDADKFFAAKDEVFGNIDDGEHEKDNDIKDIYGIEEIVTEQASERKLMLSYENELVKSEEELVQVMDSKDVLQQQRYDTSFTTTAMPIGFSFATQSFDKLTSDIIPSNDYEKLSEILEINQKLEYGINEVTDLRQKLSNASSKYYALYSFYPNFEEMSFNQPRISNYEIVTSKSELPVDLSNNIFLDNNLDYVSDIIYYDIDGNVLDDVSDAEAAMFFAIGDHNKDVLDYISINDKYNTCKFLDYKIDSIYTDDYGLDSNDSDDRVNLSEREIANYLFNLGMSKQLDSYLDSMKDVCVYRHGVDEASKVMAKIENYELNTKRDGSGIMTANFSDIWNNVINYQNTGSVSSLSSNSQVDASQGIATILAAEGFADGVSNYFDGILNFFTADGVQSVEQYKTSALVTALNNKYGDGDIIDNLFTTTYELSSSIGNMAPSMLIGMLTGSGMFGSLAMGVSAAGSSREQALAAGMTSLESFAYGVLCGTSETVLGYFLGSIPGLSRIDEVAETFGNGVVTVNPLKSYIAKLFMEGAEESSQSVLEPLLHYFVTGRTDASIDWNEVIKSGIYGMLTTGILNSGTLVIDSYKYSLTDIPTREFYKIMESYDGKDLTDSKIKIQLKADLDKYKIKYNVDFSGVVNEQALLAEIDKSFSEKKANSIGLETEHNLATVNVDNIKLLSASDIIELNSVTDVVEESKISLLGSIINTVSGDSSSTLDKIVQIGHKIVTENIFDKNSERIAIEVVAKNLELNGLNVAYDETVLNYLVSGMSLVGVMPEHILMFINKSGVTMNGILSFYKFSEEEFNSLDNKNKLDIIKKYFDEFIDEAKKYCNIPNGGSLNNENIINYLNENNSSNNSEFSVLEENNKEQVNLGTLIDNKKETNSKKYSYEFIEEFNGLINEERQNIGRLLKKDTSTITIDDYKRYVDVIKSSKLFLKNIPEGFDIVSDDFLFGIDSQEFDMADEIREMLNKKLQSGIELVENILTITMGDLDAIRAIGFYNIIDAINLFAIDYLRDNNITLVDGKLPIEMICAKDSEYYDGGFNDMLSILDKGLKSAKRNNSKITKDLVSVAKLSKGSLLGYDEGMTVIVPHSLKTEDSAARKIYNDWLSSLEKKGFALDIENAKDGDNYRLIGIGEDNKGKLFTLNNDGFIIDDDGIHVTGSDGKDINIKLSDYIPKDLLRYTIESDQSNYVSTVALSVKELLLRGYKVKKSKMSWPGKFYQGINLTFEKGTQIFELQFHTKESFYAKDDGTHLFYEIKRNKLLNDGNKASPIQLLVDYGQMLIQSQVEIPQNASKFSLIDDLVKFAIKNNRTISLNKIDELIDGIYQLNNRRFDSKNDYSKSFYDLVMDMTTDGEFNVGDFLIEYFDVEETNAMLFREKYSGRFDKSSFDKSVFIDDFIKSGLTLPEIVDIDLIREKYFLIDRFSSDFFAKMSVSQILDILLISDNLVFLNDDNYMGNLDIFYLEIMLKTFFTDKTSLSKLEMLLKSFSSDRLKGVIEALYWQFKNSETFVNVIQCLSKDIVVKVLNVLDNVKIIDKIICSLSKDDMLVILSNEKLNSNVKSVFANYLNFNVSTFKDGIIDIGITEIVLNNGTTIGVDELFEFLYDDDNTTDFFDAVLDNNPYFTNISNSDWLFGVVKLFEVLKSMGYGLSFEAADIAEFYSFCKRLDLSNDDKLIVDFVNKFALNRTSLSFELKDISAVDQGAIRKMFDPYYDKNSKVKKMRRQLIYQVTEFFPGMSIKLAAKFLKSIDVSEDKGGTGGVCNYADVCKFIFEIFKGNEQQFQQLFGFPMYVDGQLNDAQLLCDMFVSISGEILVKKSSDRVISGDWDEHKFNVEINAENYELVNAKYENLCNRGLATRKYKLELIANYLKNKGIIEDLGVLHQEQLCNSINIYTNNNFVEENYVVNDILVKVANALHSGQHVSISSFGKAKSDTSVSDSVSYLELLDENGKVVEKIDTGGHIMTVRGFDNKGRLIIESWKEIYYVDVERTINNNVEFSINSIYFDKASKYDTVTEDSSLADETLGFVNETLAGVNDTISFIKLDGLSVMNRLLFTQDSVLKLFNSIKESRYYDYEYKKEEVLFGLVKAFQSSEFYVANFREENPIAREFVDLYYEKQLDGLLTTDSDIIKFVSDYVKERTLPGSKVSLSQFNIFDIFSPFNRNIHGIVKLRDNLIIQLVDKLDNVGKKISLRLLKLLESSVIGEIDGVANFSILSEFIFKKYDGRDKQFEKNFGFSMYLDGGVNKLQLITDMFIYTLQSQYDGMSFVEIINDLRKGNIVFDLDYVNKYLIEKGVITSKDRFIQERLFDFRRDLASYTDINKIIDSILLDIGVALNNNKQVVISLDNSKKALANSIDLLDEDGKLISRLYNEDGLSVIGVTNDGKLVVYVNNSRCYIDIRNMIIFGKTFNIDSIYLNKFLLEEVTTRNVDISESFVINSKLSIEEFNSDFENRDYNLGGFVIKGYEILDFISDERNVSMLLNSSSGIIFGDYTSKDMVYCLVKLFQEYDSNGLNVMKMYPYASEIYNEYMAYQRKGLLNTDVDIKGFANRFVDSRNKSLSVKNSTKSSIVGMMEFGNYHNIDSEFDWVSNEDFGIEEEDGYELEYGESLGGKIGIQFFADKANKANSKGSVFGWIEKFFTGHNKKSDMDLDGTLNENMIPRIEYKKSDELKLPKNIDGYIDISRSSDSAIEQMAVYFGDAGDDISYYYQLGYTTSEILGKLDGQAKIDFQTFLDTTRQGYFLKNLSDKELFYLRLYTKAKKNYQCINTELRNVKGNLKNVVGDLVVDLRKGESYSVKDVIKHIDSSIEKYGGLDESMLLYRGTGIEAFYEVGSSGKFLRGIRDITDIDTIEFIMSKMVGVKFKDYAYLSTSPSYSTSFAIESNYPIVMEIEAPAGTKGAYINQISQLYNEENEFLMARGTELLIKEVFVKNDEHGNKKVIVRCSVVMDNNIEQTNSTEIRVENISINDDSDVSWVEDEDFGIDDGYELEEGKNFVG